MTAKIEETSNNPKSIVSPAQANQTVKASEPIKIEDDKPEPVTKPE